ncbi:phosphotransferase [Fodinibacter luteus]|uniref:phosphotransferase n=1 Tax=Fodinibacter luteus TaxID=552064 RepID=UPI0031EF9054
MSTSAPTLRGWPPDTAWVTDPAAGEVLARQWADEHRPGRRVVATRTHSALYRGPGDVSARVSVRFDDGTGGGGADDGADGDGPASADTTLLVHERGGHLVVTAFPDDPELPTLAAVLSPGALGPVLADCLPGTYRAEVVHHPREGACVLRLDAVDDGRHRQAYAKVYPRASEASAAAGVLAAVGTTTLGGAGAEGVRLPGLLALSRPLHTTVLESLTPTAAEDGSPSTPVGPADAGRALRALHAHPPSGSLPGLTAARTVARARAEQDLVATEWPDVADAVDAPLTRATGVLEAGAAGPAVLSHGDFTPSQLTRLPLGLGLVDLDTLCLAEPATDLGRYLAYHDVRAAARGASPAAVAAHAAAFLDAYAAPSAPRAELDTRVRAHRQVNLALLALRATRRFKDARADLALTLLSTGHTTQGRTS